MKAGHCTTCDTLIWRTATHRRTEQVEIIYPRPESVYARVTTSGGVTRGIGYCALHAPPPGITILGLGVVEAVETAPARYHRWYAPAFGTYLKAWLRDHMELLDHEVDALMAQWAADRQAAEVLMAQSREDAHAG